jgi:ribosome-binding protein aMBF1 (putative translation factor)
MSDLDLSADQTCCPHQRRRRHGNYREALQQNQITGAIPLVDVGQLLRDLRNERGLSIRALAEKSQLNVNTLCLIENGINPPRHIILETGLVIRESFGTGLGK